jgi:uncharacterized protein YjiS (DUF1127 family)
MTNMTEAATWMPYGAGRPRGARRRAYDWLKGVASECLRRVVVCVDRPRQRRTLADLDDRMLRDLGITRSDVLRECAKPFWR